MLFGGKKLLCEVWILENDSWEYFIGPRETKKQENTSYFYKAKKQKTPDKL